MTRLDVELVARGLARSRGQARELVLGGRVRVAGAAATKTSHPVDTGTPIEVAGDVDHHVGRAARKLDAALDVFGLDVQGRRCIDVGASTGGFTQVLLERGAAHVCALDVGHDQLHPDIANDPRVDERSGTTVRGVDPLALGGPFDVLVCDLSFISLTLIGAELRALVTSDADLVLLVKPQFEVGRERLGKGGLVRDRRHRGDAVHAVLDALGRHGLTPLDLAPSPVRGSGGNVEVLVLATSRPDVASPEPGELGPLVDRVVADPTSTAPSAAPPTEPPTADAKDLT